MEAIWAFVSDPANRDTLAWIGGGICVVASGLWTVLSRKPKAKPPAPPPSPTVSSGEASLAAGNDISIGGPVRIESNRIPPAAYALAAAGLVLIGIALLTAGDRTEVRNGIAINGDVSDSTVTNQGGAQ